MIYEKGGRVRDANGVEYILGDFRPTYGVRGEWEICQDGKVVGHTAEGGRLAIVRTSSSSSPRTSEPLTPHARSVIQAARDVLRAWDADRGGTYAADPHHPIERLRVALAGHDANATHTQEQIAP